MTAVTTLLPTILPFLFLQWNDGGEALALSHPPVSYSPFPEQQQACPGPTQGPAKGRHQSIPGP